MAQILKAIRRVPEHLREYSFFGSWDWWRYVAIMDAETCPLCTPHHNVVYPGTVIRSLFPGLEILDWDYMHPHTHNPSTTVRDFNCRCGLIRTWSF